MKISRFIIGLTAASFIGTVFIYPHLTGSIPIHWGINGSVRTAPKEIAFLTALFPLLFYLLRIVTSKMDPRRETYEKHKKAFDTSILTVGLFLTAIHWTGLFYSLGYKIDVRFVIRLLLGLTLIFLGNYMVRIRQNYFFGIRTPWTFADDRVWKKTHRMGGYLFLIAGVVISVSAFISGQLSGVIILSVLLTVSLFCTLYSYLQFRKIKYSK